MRNLNKEKLKKMDAPCIDLRAEIDTIINNSGYHIIVIRNTPTGHSVEKHMAVSFNAAVPETLPRMLKLHQIGLISSDARAFYMRYNARISQGDWIYEVEFDSLGMVKYISRMFLVNSVEPLRNYQGRVEFLVVSCDREHGGGPAIDIKKAKYKTVN